MAFETSYVVVTYNKLPYLRRGLPRLLDAVGPDDEVVVVDGGSRDGTVEYVSALHQSGRVHQFLSERDAGEAHGWNKAFLMATGQFIKLVSDDDLFHFPEIQRCIQFMKAHPEVDVLGTEGSGAHPSDPALSPSVYHAAYRRWATQGKPFQFSGLGLLMRRSSLPLLGLFHTGMIWVDAEYAYRTTAGKANLAWYTGFTWVRLLCRDSNTSKFSARMMDEGARLERFYVPARFLPKPGVTQQVAALRKRLALGTRLRALGLLPALVEPKAGAVEEVRDLHYQHLLDLMARQVQEHPGEFLMRGPEGTVTEVDAPW